MKTEQHRAFLRKASLITVVALCCFVLPRLGFARQLQTPTLPTGLPSALPSAPSPPTTPAVNSKNDTTADDNTRNAASGQESNGGQSTSQIIAIIQARPELVVDIKEVMANYLDAQGNSIQADAITDDMLYKGIASDAGLRGAISIWLRARGYIPDSDDNSSDLDAKSSDDVTGASAGTAQTTTSLTGEIGENSAPKDPANAQTNSSRSQEKSNAPRQSERRYASSSATKPDPNSPNAIEVVHQTAPYNLQSLRDLYTQVPEQSSKLRRFGSDVFLNRGLGTKQTPVDIPIGPDYILGVGDGLIINLWGGITQNFSRTIDREGKIILPEAGEIQLAGLSLDRAKTMIQAALSQQFRDAKVAVTIAHLRTVRVYVVGDVQRPGAYDISSLSTPLNALYAAGGPTSSGSLRIVRQFRGKELIREIDLYDFLLHGVRPDSDRLEDGDSILVSPVGRQVTVGGMVKRPAIYELKNETKLADVLDDAGGLLVSAALTHIVIERVEPQGHRTTVTVDLPEGSTAESSRKTLGVFAIQDGDRINVAPVLPYSEKAIYVEGHVVRPGKFPYRDDMNLSDVLRSYQDLLPEPADRGEIVRLMPPDLRPEAIEFNIQEVLAGNEQIHLQPFDTIRITGRYESDGPKVQVHGEVLHPGTYPLSHGMTIAQLVRIAGGFNRSALLDEADLTSYDVQDGKKVLSRRDTVKIGEAVKDAESATDILLKAGDVLTIHQISGWNDIGSSVTLNGEITYPGPYGIQEGERLSSVLRRAGGLRATAYPTGAILVRNQVKDLEDKSRNELIHQIETTSAGAKLAPSLSAQDDAATLQLLIQQQKEIVERLRSQPAVGRLVIKITADIASWEGTPADIELRSGDVLTIPKKPGFVLVSGQVYNASAITYVPGKKAGWYLRHAGGSTEGGNMKEALVIRANGSVVGRRSGEWYDPGVLETKLEPGDVVVVPQKVFGGSAVLRNLFASAQVFSSIGFAAALALH